VRSWRCLEIRLVAIACLRPGGLLQGEGDDKRKQALHARRQALKQAEVAASVLGRDQEPAGQPGEEHCHRSAAEAAEDPRLAGRAPGDQYGPDGCRECAAHREAKVQRGRAGGWFRGGGNAEGRNACHDQQDAGRPADASQASARRDLAADLLNSGSKVAILAGSGARGARAELEQVAELLGAGVAKPLLGKDVLSDELPYVTGSIGLLGTRPSYEMMQECDTLPTVGSSFPYTQFLPAFDQARAVQIDIDGKYIGMRYPYEVNLLGDAAATLRALIPHLRRKEDRSWRADLESRIARWWEVMEAEAMVEADPVNPMRLFHELSARLPGNAIVTADSGSSANWYARQLRFRGETRGSLSGNLATMGPGVPYGIGAKFGHPGRPVIVFAGDGAMPINGMAELITIKHYWQEWEDPRLIIAILHNDDLNQVTWEMRAMEGAPKFTESQTLPDVDYAAFAASLGLQAISVDKPDQVGPAWDQALAADRPTVLDVRTDPNVPPIPPHATFEQAKDAAEALLKGDENRWGVIKEGVMTKVQEFLPHSGT
jgi:pyruvate dehydrogenase (quinone)